MTRAHDIESLVARLVEELKLLAAEPPEGIETTLLIHPDVLADFEDFNDFLGVADEALVALDLDGVIQIASFHPQYRFEGSEPEDIANATNRSPHPILHLLREDSLERALAGFPHPERIYEANIATLERLGQEGWAALQRQCRADADQAAGPGGTA